MWPVSARRLPVRERLRALPTSRPLTPQMIAVYRRDMASIKAFVEAGWFIHQAFYKDRHFYAISREAAPSNPADDELLAEMVTTSQAAVVGQEKHQAVTPFVPAQGG